MNFVIVLSLFLQNELAILEFIHCVVETMDRYFGNVVSAQPWKHFIWPIS